MSRHYANQHFHAIAWRNSCDTVPVLHDVYPSRTLAIKRIIEHRELWQDKTVVYYVEHYDERGRLVSARMIP